MMQLLFGGTMLIGFLSSFFFSLNWSAWNRAYMNLRGPVLDACVVNYTPSDPLAPPYFDPDLADRYINSYIQENMKPHCRSMTCKIIPTNPKNVSYYQTLELNFNVDFGSAKIARTALFHIREMP